MSICGGVKVEYDLGGVQNFSLVCKGPTAFLVQRDETVDFDVAHFSIA